MLLCVHSHTPLTLPATTCKVAQIMGSKGEKNKYEKERNFEQRHFCGEFSMNTLLTIALIIVILWLVGFFALPGVGALIHILLVIAVILVVIWLLTGKKLWK
jgi:hypothetical protein